MTQGSRKRFAVILAGIVVLAVSWRALTSWTVQTLIQNLAVRRAGTVSTVVYGPTYGQVYEVWHPRNPNKLRSGIVMFHGGGWRTGGRAEIRFGTVRRLLEQGMVVINADYRLNDMQHAVDDAETVWQRISEHAGEIGIDPRKLAIGGESAGAHLALYTAFRASRPPAAILAMYAPSDLVARIAQPRILTLLPLREDPEQAARRLSPAYFIHSGLPPVLSVHGELDSVVPISNARQLTVKLREAGVTASEAYMPAMWHSPTSDDADEIWAKIYAFFRSQPVGLLQLQ
jgi:acetyl esterase/lipase